ncbi:anthranilate synthase component I family protein [Mesohalobacter halotolerans]|uniref:Anthranilate synthase component 1 n=1 Tax=Mesohalobacter halotolerans TaxID=1883405 RepID=A0A4U5TNI4_9FLAO|nr:anthranilate synthase component I family protein [Mesohalobacter halotolerans]TKS55520.1 anthranilate synthase component I family protein [Mesohalobacter halotolerans]
MKYTLKTSYQQQLADVLTPVSVYLKLRDEFPNSILLESSDYHASDNSFSYICCNPIALIKLQNNVLTTSYPDGHTQEIQLNANENLTSHISDFKASFITDNLDFKFIYNGLFGFTAYDAVSHFEEIDITKKEGDLDIPDLYYAVYQNIIAINHFNNEVYIFEHLSPHCKSQKQNILQLLQNQSLATYHFSKVSEPISSLEDDEYIDMVKKAKAHCQRGDVFQLVLSRRFEQAFEGDEFEVYRSLRHINPSPYLFYFDYGNFKIFGSSPEAQLVIDKQMAEIHPIAGTFKRTGNDEKDRKIAEELAADPKENAEHVMLVDLARNDLSRHGKEVSVQTYKDIQFFSHVIHLVSKVTAQLDDTVQSFDLVADTFPAGTLSGAPKPMALKLIEKYETVNRNAYGGAIGFMDFKGNYNHAIIIRSFVSKNHHLFYQAGAGIVADSKPKNELQEVYNKLKALTKAINHAENQS